MSFSNVCAEGDLEMEYELRVVVEKVLVGTQEVVKRDTLKTYDVKPPESILELGLRHEEQIALLGKVQDAILAMTSARGVVTNSRKKVSRHRIFTRSLRTIQSASRNINAIILTVIGKV